MTLLWKFSVMTDSVNGFFQDPHRFQDFFLRVLRAKSKAKRPLRAFPVLRHRHQNMGGLQCSACAGTSAGCTDSRKIKIPQFTPGLRSLNLSTSAGIVVYEALRQVFGGSR